MKVIDLLSKLEKNEITNKTKFKWRDSIVINKKGTLYCNDMYFSKILNFGNAEALKEEIEIIEEDKLIEKIRQFCEYPCSDKYECWCIKEDILVNKINELVDTVNELKKENE